MTAQAPESQSPRDFPVSFALLGVPVEKAEVLFVWAHGWAHDRHDFLPFAEALATRGAHLVFDFPGFGASPKPDDSWGTPEYAEAVVKYLEERRQVKKIVWVGHSFGCRVGLCVAAKHPALIDGLFLLSAAGLPKKRKLTENIRYGSRIYLYKAMKHAALAMGKDLDALRRRFGSADYRRAGPMRPIFLNVIRENLSREAAAVQCPAYLLFGADDTETPPESGARLQRLMPKAVLELLPGHDHLSVLAAGRSIVLKRIVDFVEKLP